MACPRSPCATRFPSVIDGKCRECRKRKDKRLYREHMDAFRQKVEAKSTRYEHDVHCNAGRDKPKWTLGTGCSCYRLMDPKI